MSADGIDEAAGQTEESMDLEAQNTSGLNTSIVGSLSATVDSSMEIDDIKDASVNINADILPSDLADVQENDEEERLDKMRLCKEKEDSIRIEIGEWLLKKGLDPAILKAYKITVTSRHSSQDRSVFKITYTSPQGSILQCKGDLQHDIESNLERETLGASQLNSSEEKRLLTHKEQKDSNAALTFPLELDGIKIISLGTVNTSTNFHNAVNVYPVGYACELTISKGIRAKETITCEIRENEGCPEFCITNKSNGVTYWSSTESGVWRKYESGMNNPNLELRKTLGFFTLETELIIEGLDDVLDCEEYKLHTERGYPSQYTTTEQLFPVKSAFLLKYEREKRTRARQDVKIMSPEEKRRRETYARKKSNEDKDIARELAAIEKIRKDKEREEERKRKEKSKEEARERKEVQRLKEDQNRNQKKEEERSSKEKQRQEERYRLSYRRNINREVRAQREDMTMLVLVAFDEEEAAETSASAPPDPKAASKLQAMRVNALKALGLNGADMKAGEETVEAFLSRMRSSREVFGIAGVELDDVISLTNTTRLLKDMLGLEFSCDLESMIHRLMIAESGTNKVNSVDGVSVEEINVVRNQAEAELDRLQLCLVKQVLDCRLDKNNLLWMLDLGVTQLDGQVTYTRLPLNQLTWAEIARQALITNALTLMGRAWEDTQSCLRGSKISSAYRQAKNVARMIRYRWETRLRHNDPLKPVTLGNPSDSIDTSAMLQKCQYLGDCKQVQLILPAEPIIPPISGFQSESEITSALASSASDSSYSETYRRCMRVLLKVLNLSQAKTFVWPLDKTSNPGYYANVKFPMSFSMIAQSLLDKKYTQESQKIVAHFYSDMTLVAFNSFTYNSEHGPFNSQAQKFWQCMYRHLQTWVVSESAPEVPNCVEQICLLSHRPIIANQGMRCGRCAGMFSLDGLADPPTSAGQEAYYKYIIFPSEELINASQHEEWFCPYCLMEDSTRLVPSPQCGFTIDEMGPSVMFPWQFNKGLSNEAENIAYDYPHLRNIIEAIAVLSAIDRTSVIEKNSTSGAALRETLSPVTPRTWNVRDRVKVLLGLCDLVLQLPSSSARIESIHKDCDRLKKLCGNFGSFKEADFMRTVKNVAGAEGVALCRSMLEDLGDAGDSEHLLQSKVFEGRCFICKSSTYEPPTHLPKAKPGRKSTSRVSLTTEDTEAMGMDESMTEFSSRGGPGSRGGRRKADDDNEIILCDGCNAEVHLKCLNPSLTSAPAEDWHCSNCEARSAVRKAKDVSEEYTNIMSYRGKAEEDELINRVIDLRAISDGVALKNAEEIMEQARLSDWGEACEYCAGKETDGCSPFVLGMSRQEHEAWTKFGVEIVMEQPLPLMDHRDIRASKGTKVYFAVQGEWVEAPALEAPYFPLLSSIHGEELQDHCEECGLDRHNNGPLVVHQLCALEMFQARASRDKHDLRRKRNAVAERAIAMAGICLRPLGIDHHGREYWNFPSSKSLYICTGAGNDVDNLQLKRSLSLTGSAGISNEASHEWIVISNFNEIRVLADLMSNSGNAKLESIGKAIAKAYPEPLPEPVKSETPVVDLTSSCMDVSRGDQGGDNEAKDDDGSTLRGRDTPTLPTENDGQEEEAVVKNKPGRPSGFGAPADNTPVAMRLLTTKGQDVHPAIVINSETVFDEANMQADAHDNDEEGYSAAEFLKFSKKYVLTSTRSPAALVSHSLH